MYPIAFIYFVISSTVFVYASVDLKDFYPFGELNGDTVLPRGENQCDSVIMKLSPSYSCNMIDTEVYISTNGVISTNKSFCRYSNGMDLYLKLSDYNSGMVFAPFLTLTSTVTFGTVQFRVSYDADILKRVNSEISETGLLSYNASNALIATWIDMTFAAYTGDVDSTPKNSFQAVVTTDGCYTFAIFYYNKITWNQGDYTAPCTGDTSTGIGDSMCFAQIGCVSYGVYTCTASCLGDHLLMSNSSNTKRPGIWITPTDNSNKKRRATSINPAYQDMMGHRSLKVIIPESLNCSAEWMHYCYGPRSNCNITSTSNDVTEWSCFDTFDIYYGYSCTVMFSCDSQIKITILNNFTINFVASVFLTPPVPEVYINVLNVSMVDYSVSIELKWNAPFITELNPGCETVNISMHLFNPKTYFWNDSILIMQNVNNSGGLDIKLLQPITGLFLSEHLVFGVTGNFGPYVANQNTIFSKMFIFDLENFHLKRKVRNLRDDNVLGTVDFMGHRNLNISYRTKPGQNGLGCKFEFAYFPPVTQAIASSDNQYVTCYVPFLASYGHMSVSLITLSASTKTDINDFQLQRMGANKKQPNIYETKTKFNDILLKFTIDVLPSYPRLTVEQVGSPTESNGQFQVQMQFTWDPSEIPSEYPVLNAFIYQFDDEQQEWMKELMVSPQYIPPNAGCFLVTLSQAAITVFFNYKVMFGLGYVQGDENFVIFSKMYIPGVST